VLSYKLNGAASARADRLEVVNIDRWASRTLHTGNIAYGTNSLVAYDLDLSPGIGDSYVRPLFHWASDDSLQDMGYYLDDYKVQKVSSQAPLLTVPANLTGTSGQQVSFSVSATDADGDPVALSSTFNVTGATFTDNGNGTGAFQWTPPVSAAGTHTVTITAYDGARRTSGTVTITIA
jgi:hypothetical protein